LLKCISQITKVIFGKGINYICELPTLKGRSGKNNYSLMSKDENVQVSDTTVLTDVQMPVTKIIFSL
jgi:hypothetical protein